MTVSELVKLIQKTEPEDRLPLFDQLIPITQSKLYYRALHSCPAEADDILQKTYLTIVDKIDSLRNPNAFWSWSYRIVQNHIRDYLRGRGSGASAQDLYPFDVLDQFAAQGADCVRRR